MAKFKHKEETRITSEGLPLVGIDMGSSSFKMLAAEETDPSNPYGSQLRIVAAEQSGRYRCVQKGIVHNTTEASYMIREMLRLMSNRLHLEDALPTAFCLLGGRTMRSHLVNVVRDLGYKGTIRQGMLDEMEKECMDKISRAKSQQSLVGLDARESLFIIDGIEQTTHLEVNSSAKHIEASYSTFYGILDLKEKVNGAFERAGKSIEHAFARPSALLEALASEEDERIGLAIIDMGADTTTISIYKGSQFLSTKVMEWGGNIITSDIQHLGISQADAEKLKLHFGSATCIDHDKRTIRIRNVQPGGEPILITVAFLSEIINARLNEIMHPIFCELQQYTTQIGQVYITGGASKMQNMVEYVASHTTLPVTYGSHADWLDESTDPAYYGPEYSAVVGALLLGAKYRRAHPGHILPDTKITNGKSNFIDRLTDLFTQA